MVIVIFFLLLTNILCIDKKYCPKDLNCQVCDTTTGKCKQLCRFDYYYSTSQDKCIARTKLVDFCIAYQNYNQDDGQCSNCFEAYTIFTDETQSPTAYSCEKSEGYFECVHFCRYCATKLLANNSYQKYCMGCDIGYIGSHYDSITKWTIACTKGSCGENCRNCSNYISINPFFPFGSDRVLWNGEESRQQCVACRDRYMISKDDRLSC